MSYSLQLLLVLSFFVTIFNPKSEPLRIYFLMMFSFILMSFFLTHWTIVIAAGMNSILLYCGHSVGYNIFPWHFVAGPMRAHSARQGQAFMGFLPQP